MRDIENKAHNLLTQRKTLALYVSPRFDYLPIEAQRYDEPLLPYGRLIFEATGDLLGGIVFDLAAYAQFGAAGTVALERSIRLFADHVVTIIDGPFADPSFITLLDDLSFSPDAITVTGDAWSAFMPNARLITTPSSGLRHLDRNSLTVAGTMFEVAGPKLLENARSIDFRKSLAAAVSAFLNRAVDA